MTYAHPRNRATPSQVNEHAIRALDAAVEFFGLGGSEFKIELMFQAPSGDGAASLVVHADYLRGTIRLDMDFAQEHPELIWGNLGHEVAHLVTRELQYLMDELTEPETFQRREYLRGLETTTTRLERLFLRHCPDPGWAS